MTDTNEKIETLATITAVITNQRITVTGERFPDDEPDPQLAGRAIVVLKTAHFLTPDDIDNDTYDVCLTIETAVVLARKLLMAAGTAMHHDPGPWRMKQTDMDVLQAAVNAHNADVTEALTDPELLADPDDQP